MTAHRNTLTGVTLSTGSTRGALVTLAEPLSFWGGFDAVTGNVIDRRHPDMGRCLTGKIVRVTAARGSSSGSSVLAEAIRLGTAPLGFIIRERDAILLLAALVAAELYSKPCVIVQLEKSAYDALDTAETVSIHATRDAAAIEILENPMLRQK